MLGFSPIVAAPLMSVTNMVVMAYATVDQTTWVAYHQALRGMPQQTGFPDNVIWPTKP